MKTRLHLIRSPTAGNVRRRLGAHALLETFEADGCDVVDITGPTAEASEHALSTAVEAGAVERVVVAGGDGIVHLAIQHLARTEIPLGIVASGTGNDFALALGIGDADPLAALGPASPVDLMQVRPTDGVERWIATVAITGFPASINARANRIGLPFLGSAVYTVAAAIELPRFRRQVTELVVDDEALTSDSAMLAIGNTRYFGGGMVVCPDAEVDDGLLHLTSIEGVGRVGILRHLANKSGGTADRPEVRRATARRLSITTPGVDVWGDGEPVAVTPVELEVVPGALRVTGTSLH